MIQATHTSSPPRTTSDFPEMIQIIFWNSLGFMFYNFLLPYVTAVHFQISGTAVGFIIAAQPFGRLFVTPLVGYLTDHYSKKRLVMIGSWGRTISYMTMYISICVYSIVGFGIGVILQGILVAFFWPPLNTLIAEKSSKFYRSTAFGKRWGVVGWGSLTGAALSLIIFNLGQYYTPANYWIIYSSMIIFAAVNIIAGFRFNRRVNEDNTFYHEFPDIEESQLAMRENNIKLNGDTPLEHLKHQKKTTTLVPLMGFVGGFILLLLAHLVSHLNDEISRPFFQIYLLSDIRLSEFITMLILYVTNNTALLLSPIIGRFCDQIKPHIGLAIICTCGAFVTFLFTFVQTPFLFFMILLFDAIFTRSGTLIIQNVFSRISIRQRGSIFGWMDWIALIGNILGPLGGGLAWDYLGHKFPFYFSIGIELSLILFYIAALYRLRPYLTEKTHEDKPSYPAIKEKIEKETKKE